MPKIVVYVRADDARVIEATEGREIGPWVRALVRDEISEWYAKRAEALGARPMPEPWVRHQENQGRE